ncbi:MAG TPA: malectin domain-containing carbohydrate-binding protein [Ktedonobacteraceae bacterium]|nr:malectin domain-containing carbohydrate-binding protein [Ktedonobacteraceae bacterium]
MPQPLFDDHTDHFPDSMMRALHRKPIQWLTIIVTLLTMITGLFAAYPLFASRLVTHAAATLVSRINVGGSAITPFAADTDFTDGSTAVSKATINTSGVSNPPPQAVYQSYRYGAFSYTLPKFTPGASYTVRLDFAEMYWKQTGRRIFSVSANGRRVLSNFDILATAGGPDKAVAEQFSVTADEKGAITLQFTKIRDNAQVNGIEVLGGNSPVMSTSKPTSAVGVPTSNQTTGTPPVQLTTPSTPTGPSVVHVTGTQGNWQLTVNGSPYQMKGVTFGPSNATAGEYMADLKSMGVNTLRTWGTNASTQPLLDSAAAYGIKVVNSFWLNQGTDYLNDTTYKTNTLNNIKNWVTTYKNHPGVLMWDVGNEVILTLQNTYSGTKLQQERNAYAQYVDQIAKAIHAIDPNHPVTSTDAWTGAWSYYKANSPNLDLYAVNSYGSVCTIKQKWISGGYTKPYIVTETGPAGEWEVPNDVNGVPSEPTDTQKRDAYLNAWNCIIGHTGVSLGATLFHYGIENDFGSVWLSMLTGHWKRLSYYSVKQAFTGQSSANTPPVISSMSLSQTSVPAGGQFTVNVNVSDPNGDPMHYNLMLNSKYINKSTGLQNATFTQTGSGSFMVTAPQKVGVWKVYVYVYDGQGNVGIETKSFKVV